MSSSNTSTVDDSSQPSGRQEAQPQIGKTKDDSRDRHASWSEIKTTSDGHTLTLDSPRGSPSEGHVRYLSGQLLELNLSPDNSVTYSPDHDGGDSSEYLMGGVPSSKAQVYPTQQKNENVGRKHRRGFSGGKTHPSMAHRRINSGGNAAFINRHGEYTSANTHLGIDHNHHRLANQVLPAEKQHFSLHEQQQGTWGHQQRSGPVQKFHEGNQRYDYHYTNHNRDRHDRYGEYGDSSRRTSPIPAPNQTNPIEDGYYPNQGHSDFYRRNPQHGAAPRYQQHHTGRHSSPHGSVESGSSNYHRYSPQSLPVSYPDELSSSSSGSNHNAMHKNRHNQPRYPRSSPPLLQGYYPRPRANRQVQPYPVQGVRNDRKPMHQHPPLPSHPLADHGLPPQPPPDYFQRQTSIGSEDMIKTDEKLFSSGRDFYNHDPHAPKLSSSPRISPQLFDAALHGRPLRSSPPPEVLYNRNSYIGEEFGSEGRDHNQHTLPAHSHNRARSSSSDRQIKQFMTAVENSTHKRGDSTDSFILDDNLFGESILEPIRPSGMQGPPVDSFAPYPVPSSSAAEHFPEGPGAYNIYPDRTQSESKAPVPVGSSTANVPQVATNSQRSSISPTPKSKQRQITGNVSKRTRRKCSVPECQNRVVQGGLCISHGAKRKICGHPGCTKHVKKAGMCSAHGPPRKLCEFEGCTKVSVQGGKCIAHGARKKMCSVESCKKQAILGGMCKKHHDLSQEEEGNGVFCQIISGTGKNSKKKTGHRRGLSEDDMNTVNQSLSSDASEGQKPKHSRGLSIFTDQDVAEKIIKREINL